MNKIIRDLDIDVLSDEFQNADPFPFIIIDDFLDAQFAREVAASYPSYEQASEMGREFNAVNERLKIQITDSSRFPGPVKQLSDALAHPDFLSVVTNITGISKLLADEALSGGGIHMTGPGGRLDVHVDFNYEEARALHRRLNILIYLNETWEDTWGGNLELWDPSVKHCVHSLEPRFNRCVIFKTSDISYHGVTPVVCPENQLRRSFAAYYYTREAPAHWDGKVHSTIFRARPNEVFKGRVLMPLSAMRHRATHTIHRMKQIIRPPRRSA